MSELKDKLIVALDVSTLKEAEHFVNILYPAVKMFKVGSQLFTACGPEAVKMVGKRGARVFLDLKFHDIPNTVYSSTASAASILISTAQPASLSKNVQEVLQAGVFMMTVHTDGGIEMMRRALEGAKQKAEELNIRRPFIVGVTVLTSNKNEEGTEDVVLERAELAYRAGLDGIVCSVHEARAVRDARGKDFIIVTPGIRSKGADRGDQKRTATVAEAIDSGSDFLVIGRPILEADDPLRALEELA